MFGGWTMPVHFFRSEPGAAELRRLARREGEPICGVHGGFEVGGRNGAGAADLPQASRS
jgi:hypothetical protein